MTTVPGDEIVIQFEGLGSGAYEIWGGTQANFLLDLPGYNAREIALMVNDPSAEFIAERTGIADTPEFRARLAELSGQIWIRRLLDTGQHIGPAITISRALFEQNPDFLAEVEAALKASAA